MIPIPTNVLVLSHFNEGLNRVFEDYCHGIQANAQLYHYLDYIAEYVERGKTGLESRIETLVEAENIDCIFFVLWSSDLTFDPEFIARLGKSARIVMNFFDTEYFFEGVDRYYSQAADLVLLPDCLSRFKYHQLGVQAVSTFAMFDGQHYANQRIATKTLDVSFVGNVKQSTRRMYIDYLEANGVSVDAYGMGSRHGFASFDRMVEVFNTSKINLNFTALSGSSNYVVKPPRINERIRQSKGRPIEIALCGGMILSEYAPGIEEMFDIGAEMDVFHGKEDLLAKIKHYLSHDEARARMAARAYDKAVARYDVKAGFANVFKLVGGLPTRAPGSMYLDGDFLDNYAAYRWFYIVVFALRGRLARVGGELMVVVRGRRLPLAKSYYFALKGFLFHMRSHPQLEQRLRDLKNRLRLKVKY